MRTHKSQNPLLLCRCSSKSQWRSPPAYTIHRFPSQERHAAAAAAPPLPLSHPVARSRGPSRDRTTPPIPLAACGDDDALPDPEQRRSPLDLAPLLVATAVAAAANPHAALASSGGSMGGWSNSDSSPTSFSSSSSWDDESTSDSLSSLSWFSSSSSSPEKEEAEATHESVGTAAPSPVAASPDMRFWGNLALASSGAVALFLAVRNYTPPRTTAAVVKLQVALRGVAMAKSLQKGMDEIAEKVEASNRRWYKFILTGTISSLRRHKDLCISSSLSEHCNKISIEERSKFDEETLFNLQGIKRKKSYSKKTDGSRNEYLVLTILVAADGPLKFPEVIRCAADLEAVVEKLYSASDRKHRGVIVLWTPQDEDDVLSEEMIQKDYPYLKPLRA